MAIGLGANAGRPAVQLRRAIVDLGEILESMRCSRTYETEPESLADGPPFLNLCCVGTVSLGPRELLEILLRIEREAGRQEPPREGPRTLDLDLLLYGEETVDRPGLRVPHPRLTERNFALLPLAEIAPAWVVPGEGETVGALARRMDRSGVLRTGSLESFLDDDREG